MLIGEYIEEELASRSWSIADLAEKMSGDKTQNELKLDLIVCLSDKQLLLDDETAKNISTALGVHPNFIGNLNKKLNEAL
jgi:plasmid maintenance system antidote protein VapI